MLNPDQRKRGKQLGFTDSQLDRIDAALRQLALTAKEENMEFKELKGQKEMNKQKGFTLTDVLIGNGNPQRGQELLAKEAKQNGNDWLRRFGYLNPQPEANTQAAPVIKEVVLPPRMAKLIDESLKRLGLA